MIMSKSDLTQLILISEALRRLYSSYSGTHYIPIQVPSVHA
jgi:hypothetical protein